MTRKPELHKAVIWALPMLRSFAKETLECNATPTPVPGRPGKYVYPENTLPPEAKRDLRRLRRLIKAAEDL